ncbi:MAG: rhodanese-like domain-containing protein, partial [Burkholderiaceae bacterium]
MTEKAAKTAGADASAEHAQPVGNDALYHSAFYKFVELRDPELVAALLRELAKNLTGSILVAQEGINGVVAGTREVLENFEQALLRDVRFESRFADMQFKRSACKTRPFARMKVHAKEEIVALGLPEVVGVDAIRRHGKQISPQQWRELIAQDDVVLIDNRNSFEYRLGRFKNAIDPQVSNFRDFPKYIEANAPGWREAGTRVAMYCTGGIRCEKTGAWMEKLGLDVYELEGGIL